MAYFRAMPIRSLVVLCAAAFFLFCSVGLLSTLRSSHVAHLVYDFTWSGINGIFAVFYILLITRRPLVAPILVVFQIAASVLMSQHVPWFDRLYPPIPFIDVVHLYAGYAVICTVVAYILFFVFIQTEGRQAFSAQTELALAHSIQATLVPMIDTVVAGCEVYGISVPSEKVGGDLVDLVALPDGSAVAYVADIAGHGLQAGILMGMVKSAARTSLLNLPSPDALFHSLNRVLPGVKEANMYATCAALHLEPRPGIGCEVTYSLAGHPAILHLRASGEAGPQLSDQQLPLGILPQAEYRSHTILAAPGDLLIATTDGILEVCGKDGVELGAEGLEELLRSSTRQPLAGIAEQILSAARSIGPQNDDRTLLLVRVL